VYGLKNYKLRFGWGLSGCSTGDKIVGDRERLKRVKLGGAAFGYGLVKSF
jgi:hypothetical protein